MSDEMIQIAFAGLSPARVDRLLERYQTPSNVVTAVSRHRVKVTDRSRRPTQPATDRPVPLPSLTPIPHLNPLCLSKQTHINHLR